MAAKKNGKKATKTKPAIEIVGEEAMAPIGNFKPNDWNPNHMSPTQRASLRHGLATDGWLRSQKLLIWRTDEKGKVQNIIIDGEHRWLVARDMKFDGEVPVVYLDRITREQAIEYTLKFIYRHGDPDLAEVTDILKNLPGEDPGTMALDLGMDADFVARALSSLEPPPLPSLSDVSPSTPPPGVEPRSYALVLSFARVEDKNRVGAFLDGMNKSSRTAALLHLIEQTSARA